MRGRNVPLPRPGGIHMNHRGVQNRPLQTNYFECAGISHEGWPVGFGSLADALPRPTGSGRAMEASVAWVFGGSRVPAQRLKRRAPGWLALEVGR
jgi:hypothetical protein